MRGNPETGRTHMTPDGSIPAHAGKPVSASVPANVTRVYPRACGETTSTPAAMRTAVGLSPRMRGNRVRARAHDFAEGSIPAHAGKPLRSMGALPVDGVYPRACGETMIGTSLRYPNQGLSPRMRGNLTSFPRSAGCQRSIPAHAGKPLSPCASTSSIRVYPRACGETFDFALGPGDLAGLSPRMRGNRFTL